MASCSAEPSVARVHHVELPLGGISSVSCVRSNWCRAVGDVVVSRAIDRPLTEQWNGTGWRTLPATSSDLAWSSVTCLHDGTCVQLGQVTTPNGSSYSVSELCNWLVCAAPARIPSIVGWFACSPQGSWRGEPDCFAAGLRANTQLLLYEKTPLQAWRPLQVPPAARQMIPWQMACASTVRCLILGETFQLHPIAFQFGKHVSIQAVPFASNRLGLGVAGIATGLSCPAPDDCIAMAGSQPPGNSLVSVGNGSEWKFTTKVANDVFENMSCGSPASCLLLGTRLPAESPVKNTIVAVAWSGARVHPVSLPHWVRAVDALFCDPSQCLMIATNESGEQFGVIWNEASTKVYVTQRLWPISASRS